MTNYIALLRKDPTSDYGVEFPDFPGCITAAKTVDEAKELAQEALKAHVELMLEGNEPMPDASSLENIMRIKGNKDAVAFMVSIPFKAKSIRFNATIDQDLLAAIDNKARSLGKTRSAFLADAARSALKNL